MFSLVVLGRGTGLTEEQGVRLLKWIALIIFVLVAVVSCTMALYVP
jgi:hypothetical protein